MSSLPIRRRAPLTRHSSLTAYISRPPRPFASNFYEVLPVPPPETPAKYSCSDPSRPPSTKYYLYRRRKLQPSTPVPTLDVHFIRSTTWIAAGNSSQAPLHKLCNQGKPSTRPRARPPPGNLAIVVVAIVQNENEYLVTPRMRGLL